ncbi:unnamed protein product [Ilex paraguariensis]|uniref:Uncharacterized protein n=1 Tax=Ilex paraguariensis TaxID=185542 RepID=A0ABC8REP4_9AQUA
MVTFNQSSTLASLTYSTDNKPKAHSKVQSLDSSTTTIGVDPPIINSLEDSSALKLVSPAWLLSLKEEVSSTCLSPKQNKIFRTRRASSTNPSNSRAISVRFEMLSPN